MLVGMAAITVSKQGSGCQHHHLFHQVPHITLYVGSVKQIPHYPRSPLIYVTSLCRCGKWEPQNCSKGQILGGIK